jgi:hypothetical protein
MRYASHLLTLGALALFAANSATLAAHEKGVLTLAAPSAAAGQSLAVTGSDFGAGTALRLVLRGALREYELAGVRADEGGSFRLDVIIPETVPPGAYRVVAVAEDGDDTAAADLEVQAPVAASAEHAHQEASGAGMSAAAAVPQAGPLAIERRWSGVEWFVLGLLLGAALAGGIALYRRPHPEA